MALFVQISMSSSVICC